ncbi:MAG TPA: universal stress protein [Streptosporangiaceae bacterium]|jgi:nucleotide-binding universal stress UspA family protein
MTVMVSIDGSAGTTAAIRLAAREAEYRQCPLVAVTAYSGQPVLGAPAARPVATLRTPADEQVEAEMMLRDAVDEALGEAAAGVELRVIRGLAGRRFVEAAREARAELIVLAGRGSMSLLLGAVSQYVLRHAPCPVLVVPDGSTDA